VSGHPGLELCNTLAGWNGPPEHEYLVGYPHLLTGRGRPGCSPAPMARRWVLGPPPTCASSTTAPRSDARSRPTPVSPRRFMPRCGKPANSSSPPGSAACARVRGTDAAGCFLTGAGGGAGARWTPAATAPRHGASRRAGDRPA